MPVARHLRLSAVALTAVIGLVVGGCGGGDGNGSATAADTPSTTIPGTLADVPKIEHNLEASVVTVLSTLPNGRVEGAGVAWDDHTIVTNNHVIQGASKVQVALSNGQRVDAKVRATDPLRDLAIVHVDATLPPAKFADTIPAVGSLAVAMGSPLGLEETVTAGIVSGLDRALPSGPDEPGALVGLLQTDAAISPGNSGGALVDANSQVIGINVAYVPPQTGAVALGFSIPSPIVRGVVEQLIKNGHAVHPYLGIRTTPLTPAMVQRFHPGTDHGVVVLEIAHNGPADKAGLQPGDIITKLGDRDIGGLSDLYTVLLAHKPGDKVAATIVRDGKSKRVELTLGTRPANASTG